MMSALHPKVDIKICHLSKHPKIAEKWVKIRSNGHPVGTHRLNFIRLNKKKARKPKFPSKFNREASRLGDLTP